VAATLIAIFLIQLLFVLFELMETSMTHFPLGSHMLIVRTVRGGAWNGADPPPQGFGHRHFAESTPPMGLTLATVGVPPRRLTPKFTRPVGALFTEVTAPAAVTQEATSSVFAGGVPVVFFVKVPSRWR